MTATALPLLTALLLQSSLSSPDLAGHSPTIDRRDDLIAAAWSARPRGEPPQGRVSVSTDGGEEWSDPVTFSGGRPVGAGWQNGPIVRIAPGGTIHVVWSRSGVYHVRSSDRGRTWSEPRSIGQDDHCEKSGVAVGPEGAIHVAWLRRAELWYARSTDGGDSFSTPRNLSADQEDPVCECCLVTPLAVSADRVYLFFRNAIDDWRDPAFFVSTDGGATFEGPRRVTERRWRFESCPADGPAPAVDPDGTLHLAWMDGSDGTSRIWYAASTDGGETWSDPRAVDPDGGGTHPRIIATEAGDLWIVWTRTDNRRIALARSTDGGATFDRAGGALGHRGDQVYPWLAAEGEMVHVIWEQFDRIHHERP